MKLAQDKIVLNVDYSKKIQQMISGGRYDKIDKDINCKNFPLPCELIGKKVEVCADLFYFNHDISSKNVINEMDKENCRPATLAELLVLGEIKPDLQQEGRPIIALGSSWNRGFGHFGFPFLYHYRGDRTLSIGWYYENWSHVFYFLGICK